MRLFLRNSDMPIPNLPHAKLSFVFFLIKNKMAAKICENFTTVHHGLAHNEHKNIILVSKITFFVVREFSYDVSEGHIATIIIKQWPLEGKIQNDRHCNVMCLNYASK